MSDRDKAYESEQKSARGKDVEVLRRQVVALQEVTDAFFPMFDNLDTCVTQKAKEVVDLKQRVSALEKRNEDLEH